MELKAGAALLAQYMQEHNIPLIDLKDGILPPQDATRTKIERLTLAPGTTEVDATDIEGWFDYDTKLFRKGDVCGVVYIHTIPEDSQDPEELPKWHITMCLTLRKKRKQKQLYEKYAIKDSTLIDDAFPFTLAPSWQMEDAKKVFRQPRFCKHCRKTEMFRSLRGGNVEWPYRFSDYVQDFKNSRVKRGGLNLANFQSNPRPNAYTSDFKERARQYKKEKDFCCNRCGEQFEAIFLEVHHKDRNKSNDRRENWELLCLLCHIEEHGRDNPRMRAGYKANGRLGQFFAAYPHKQPLFR